MKTKLKIFLPRNYKNNVSEYEAKERERKAGTIRTKDSWKKYLNDEIKNVHEEKRLAEEKLQNKCVNKEEEILEKHNESNQLTFKFKIINYFNKWYKK